MKKGSLITRLGQPRWGYLRLNDSLRSAFRRKVEQKRWKIRPFKFAVIEKNMFASWIELLVSSNRPPLNFTYDLKKDILSATWDSRLFVSVAEQIRTGARASNDLEQLLHMKRQI